VPPRMQNPAMIVPGAVKALLSLNQQGRNGAVPDTTLELVHLRASQVNGCSSSVCVTDAERAALALAEAVTRLTDRTDPVPDAVWDDAAGHYDELALAALVLSIATTDALSRLNVSTRQLPGAWG